MRQMRIKADSINEDAYSNRDALEIRLFHNEAVSMNEAASKSSKKSLGPKNMGQRKILVQNFF